jgi:DNA-binding GntR family transcriptional regulator
MSPFDSAGPAPTAVDRVADAVRSDILSGALGADAPLREEAAAERYGVSRHTVRAAFQRLVAERLAVALPYRGVRVASFDRDTIIALQQLRAALEVEAVRIARERFGSEWPDAALAPAREALDRLAALRRAADAEVDWLEAERIHADFHRALVAASASPRIIEAHVALGSELLLFLLHVRPHYTLETLLDEHRALLDDVQSRGPDALREHLEHSTRLLVGE